MKKKLLSAIVFVVIVGRLHFDVLAQSSYTNVSNGRNDLSYEGEYNSKIENQMSAGSDTDSNEPQRINRTGVCYCLGGGSWGHITGDNNAVGEGVYVTNLMSKNIEVKGYSESGTLRGSHTILPGQREWFGFWIWDGTYYFKVRYQDLSEGEITIYMKSDWYLD